MKGRWGVWRIHGRGCIDAVGRDGTVLRETRDIYKHKYSKIMQIQNTTVYKYFKIQQDVRLSSETVTLFFVDNLLVGQSVSQLVSQSINSSPSESP
jgi:hypothetical protein